MHRHAVLRCTMVLCLVGLSVVYSKPVEVEAANAAKARVAAQLEERGGLLYAPGEQQPFTGRKVSLHSNGQKEEEGEVKAGNRAGAWTQWYADGQKNSDGAYQAGQRVGSWSEWYPDGQKSSHGAYQDGRKTGRWTHWYENGQKNSAGAYQAGQRVGSWSEWYPDGQKSSHGAYQDGRKTGRWTHWYENGQKKEEGEFADSWPVGRWTWWYETGQKKEEGAREVVDASDWRYEERLVRDGEWTFWHKGGQKKAQGLYKLGERQGAWTVLGEDGQVGLDVNPKAGVIRYFDAQHRAWTFRREAAPALSGSEGASVADHVSPGRVVVVQDLLSEALEGGRCEYLQKHCPDALIRAASSDDELDEMHRDQTTCAVVDVHPIGFSAKGLFAYFTSTAHFKIDNLVNDESVATLEGESTSASYSSPWALLAGDGQPFFELIRKYKIVPQSFAAPSRFPLTRGSQTYTATVPRADLDYHIRHIYTKSGAKTIGKQAQLDDDRESYIREPRVMGYLAPERGSRIVVLVSERVATHDNWTDEHTDSTRLFGASLTAGFK